MLKSFTMRVFAKLKDIRIPEMGDEKIYVSMGEAFYKGKRILILMNCTDMPTVPCIRARIIQATVRHLNA